MNLLRNKKLLIVLGIIALLVAILLISGALKFNFAVTRSSSSEPTNQTEEQTEAPAPAPTENPPFTKITSDEPKLATRPVTFSAADGELTFSIRLPVGWATASDSRVDFVAGSLTSEKLGDGQTFTANLNAVGDRHSPGMATFADYQTKWLDATLEQYPSMEKIVDYTTQINDMDVYVFEVSNTRPDGLVLRQIQYVFYVDDEFALAVTGTAPLNSWITYEDAIKQSVESIVAVEEDVEVE